MWKWKPSGESEWQSLNFVSELFVKNPEIIPMIDSLRYSYNKRMKKPWDFLAVGRDIYAIRGDSQHIFRWFEETS